MAFEPYRRVLAVPGVRPLLLVGILARIPVIAIGVTLTLHVVTGMKLGFLQAGLVGAASTGGTALGAPISGRFVDRYGLRPVVAVTTVAQLVFWSSAAFLPYWPLVVSAFAAGVLALPVFNVIRQCLAAAVPVERRRTAFALDSMLIEVSYMVGPAVAVAATTAFGSDRTMALVGLGLVGSGTALLVLNPRTRDRDEPEAAETVVPRRQWLTPRLFALLGITCAATFVLTATELNLVAVLKADAATRWTGLAIALWSLSSLAGGFAYGSLPRSLSPLVTIGGMAALTVPVGLVGPWPLLCLALVPSGMLCAPSLSTTVDTLSGWVPAGARGEAVGLHSTALTLGIALASPITGFLIDHAGTGWSFAVTGTGSLLAVTLAVPLWRRAPRPVRPEAAAATGMAG
ncbi:MFS transporter [Actinoallomurus oryzae]|uniref:MFS transporter n=1 Tax=Actinoallomurus oryzae TaxID=502180 RepID=A0ABP8QS32_9ACTN